MDDGLKELLALGPVNRSSYMSNDLAVTSKPPGEVDIHEPDIPLPKRQKLCSRPACGREIWANADTPVATSSASSATAGAATAVAATVRRGPAAAKSKAREHPAPHGCSRCRRKIKGCICCRIWARNGEKGYYLGPGKEVCIRGVCDLPEANIICV